MANPRFSAEESIALIAEQIAQLGAATCRIGGSVEFVVPGRGAWRLSLDTPNGRWSTDVDDSNADVRLVISEQHLAAFFTAPETLGPLGASGEIAVDGDVDKLIALGTLLTQRGSLLSHRQPDHGSR